MLIYALRVPPRNWPCVLALVARLAGAQELPANIVALNGAQVPRLMGVSSAEITALALHEGTMTPVRLQIDQRSRRADGSWEYAFEGGEEPRSPRTSGLGPDDLLLLASTEAGVRMRPAPEGGTEIEVLRADGTTGWFYLSRGLHAAPVSAVRYDRTADRVYGAHYALGFSRDGTAVIDSLVLGDPASGANILDRSKARLDVDLVLGIGNVHRTEEDVRVRTTGIHAGPLRIIRESEVRGRMLLGLYSAPLRDNFIFYADGFTLPTTIRVTPTARMIVRSVMLRISMDFNESAGGMTFQSEPEVPTPVAVDGQGGERGGRAPVAWYLLRRGDVGLLGWLQAREDVAREVVLYYRDDRAHADSPEAVAGEFGDHGFLFRHAGPLFAGAVRLTSHVLVLRGEALDRPGAELRAFATRPTVRVH